MGAIGFDIETLNLDDIADKFERDGFVIVRGALSREEMAPIQAQWGQVRTPLVEGKTIDGIKRDNFYIHGKLPSPVGDVYQHPRVVEVAKRLLGPDVAVYLNRLNVKDQAFKDPIHLHQDIPYFNGGVDKINFFIALQEINLNNGAMVFVPKSQEHGILDRKTIDLGKYPELEVVVPSLSPGDLVIADIRLWHSSVPNTIGTDRVLLQMIFQPADDGSYYPLSVPAPTLVTGEWRTDQFPAWQTIRSETAPSQLVKDGAKNPMAPTAAKQPAVTTAATPSAPSPQTSTVMFSLPGGLDWKTRVKAALPPRVKRVIKRMIGHPGAVTTPFVYTETPTMTVTTAGTAPQNTPSSVVRSVPKLFTPSTGPEQVWPLPEASIDWAKEIVHTAQCLKARGKTRILLGFRQQPSPAVVAAATANGLTIQGHLQITGADEPKLASPDGKPVYFPKDLPKVANIDAVVVLCSVEFGLTARLCEQYLRNDVLFVPAARESIVAQPVRDASPSEWAVRSSILTYLQCSGLRGHFAEFGTFWGRAFFNSFYELNHWLEGKFFAFDSFAGLSEPDPRESDYTNGDFKKGAYGFSHDSFVALGDILGLPQRRIVTVPGFFDASLTPNKPTELGIAPKSISVCRIDCDLLDPTLSVLNFITPLLDDGALVYFDDWRLCRADPNVGERGAVLQWLKTNPSFDLVDFHSCHWQHQWFIFHRQKSAFQRLKAG